MRTFLISVRSGSSPAQHPAGSGRSSCWPGDDRSLVPVLKLSLHHITITVAIDIVHTIMIIASIIHIVLHDLMVHDRVDFFRLWSKVDSGTDALA